MNANNNNLDLAVDYIREQLKNDELEWCPYPKLKNGLKERMAQALIQAYIENHVSLKHILVDESKFNDEYKTYYRDCKKNFEKIIVKHEMQMSDNDLENLANLTDSEVAEIFFKGEKLDFRFKNNLSTIPSRCVMPIDKITGLTFSDLVEDEVIPVVVGKDKDKNDIHTDVMLHTASNLDVLSQNLIEDERIHGLEHLNEFDRAVLNAVISLYCANNLVITVNQIYRLIASKPTKRIASETMAIEIRKSMYKLMHSEIKIDCGKEVLAYNYNPPKDGTRMSGWIIQGKTIENIQICGQTTEAYVIDGMQILYEYANMKNQILSVDTKYLDTPIRKDKIGIQLQYVLIQEIESRRTPKMNKTITIDRILKRMNVIDDENNEIKNQTALTEKQRHQKKVITDKMIALLEYWKGNNSSDEHALFDDYKINYKSRKSIESITIKF